MSIREARSFPGAFVAAPACALVVSKGRQGDVIGFGASPFRTSWRCSSTASSTPSSSASRVSPQSRPAHGLNAARFARFLAADWHNPEQSKLNPQGWAHIHVSFHPLKNSILHGYAFYAESAYDYNLGLPYKTSVVLIVDAPATEGTNTLELASFKIKSPEEFWMGAHEPDLLEMLTGDMLTPLSDKCNTAFVWIEDEQKYIGTSRPGKQCIIQRRSEAATYLDSRIILSRDSYSPWDIGRDVNTDEYVWGGSHGPFEMIPNKRFDHLVSDEFA
jgi:CpeT/CpcT family (DUF1001)